MAPPNIHTVILYDVQSNYVLGKLLVFLRIVLIKLMFKYLIRTSFKYLPNGIDV